MEGLLAQTFEVHVTGQLVGLEVLQSFGGTPDEKWVLTTLDAGGMPDMGNMLASRRATPPVGPASWIALAPASPIAVTAGDRLALVMWRAAFSAVTWVRSDGADLTSGGEALANPDVNGASGSWSSFAPSSDFGLRTYVSVPDPAGVPEPASGALLLAALAPAALARRRGGGAG